MSVPPGYYLALASLLFVVGAMGVLIRRNIIVMFLFVELMLNAVNLVFVTFARMRGDISGQVIVFFVLVVAAAEAVIGLAIILNVARGRGSLDADKARLLRW